MVVANTPQARRALAEATAVAAAAAEMASLPVKHAHAAGIDVSDRSHWACVDADGGDAAVREFAPHTQGLRQLVAWLKHCGATSVGLEATGVYSHVLYLTLLEAGWACARAGRRPGA